MAFVLFAISAIGLPHLMPDHVRPTPASTPTPPPEIEVDEGPDHAVIEFGWPEVIKLNNDPLHVYIRYPQSGGPTDEKIYDWVTNLYSAITTDFQTLLLSDPNALGEVNVHFNSFLVDNRYAGIMEIGDFTYSLAMPTEPVAETFNIDLTRNVFLQSTDILDYSQSDLILDLLYNRLLIEHPETGPFLEHIDDSWLNQLVIGHDGIIVVLKQYSFFPGTIPTITVTLPVEDLGPAMLVRTEPPLSEPPTASPIPEPTPTPTPPPEHEDPHYDDDDDDYDYDHDDDDESGDEQHEEPHEEPEEPDQPIQDVPPQSSTIDPSRPMIALSFDDGPGIYTNEFLDLFEKYGVRATFCTIGNLVNTQSEALARAVNMGSEVIGHSWDHKNLAKLSADDVRKQLQDTQDVIHAATNTSVMKFRPPYGAMSDTLKEVAADMGFAIILWSVDPEDWNTKDADAVYNAVMAHIIDGAIILSHEIYKSTLEAYKRIIPDLIDRGYQLVTVSELLYFKHGELTPGEVYGGRFG